MSQEMKDSSPIGKVIHAAVSVFGFIIIVLIFFEACLSLARQGDGFP